MPPRRSLARQIALGLTMLATAGASATAQSGATAQPVAFVDVNVVPMDRERVLERQTVVVRDGRISAMGPAASVAIPAGTLRIDARGKYLIPGLAEMHAHIPGANASEQVLRDLMFLYVANGVTTIRGMLGAPNQLELRSRTASGDIVGPTIYVGAPSLNGQSAASADVARALVRQHKTAGYDLLKLHPGLTREVYDAIAETAREVGITFGGHVSQGVGIEHTLATRQSTVDHLDGYLEGALPDSIRRGMETGTVPFGVAVRSVDDAKLRDLARRTREAGVWNVPTAYLWESFFSAEAPEEMAKRPEMKYASPQAVTAWSNQKRNRIQQDAQNNVTPADAQAYLAARRRILKALGDAGAPLLMGTDSPQMFNVPGFALHREIALMVEAGLTPYQVLESGTRNVATYAAQDLKLDGRFGTVAVGNRADLVLLDGNPLADIGNVSRRSGVMVRGRWLASGEIQKGLDEIAARLNPGS